MPSASPELDGGRVLSANVTTRQGMHLPELASVTRERPHMPPAARGSQKIAGKSVSKRFPGVKTRFRIAVTRLNDPVQDFSNAERAAWHVGGIGWRPRHPQSLMVDTSVWRALQSFEEITYQRFCMYRPRGLARASGGPGSTNSHWEMAQQTIS